MAEMMSEDQYMERKRWVFLGLPFTFTTYHVAENVITIDSGFFRKVENDCYMYKVQDVKLATTLLERIFGLGTITCYTGDVTNAELKLIHIKKSKEVKNYLLKASEAARMKRRTLNTLDIGAEQDLSDALDS